MISDLGKLAELIRNTNGNPDLFDEVPTLTRACSERYH
jgi:hypothetical protein